MRKIQVKEWMTLDPITVDPDTSLHEAHTIMTEHQIRRLPVVDRGRLVGIVTLGDVREAEPSDATSLNIWELNYLLDKLKVKEIMTRYVHTIRPDATIEDAARTMLLNKVSGLPVVEHGEVIGIITESDIFRMIVRRWEMDEESATRSI